MAAQTTSDAGDAEDADDAVHWQNVWSSKRHDEVSWFQPDPAP